MSSLVYPTLPGLEWNVGRTVLAPPVQIRTTPSQREYRARDASLPRYQYTLSYEFLRSGSQQEWQTLVGFYNQVGGDFDSFLFTDPDDSSVTDQLLGAGNGSNTIFQAVRTLGGFVEVIDSLIAVTNVKVNGTPVSHSANTSTGVITTSAAPAGGSTVTWTGTFYRRCRFLRGQMEFRKFMQDYWEAKRVEIISLKAGSQ